jgi:ASC-1-like (ASCH) protein
VSSIIRLKEVRVYRSFAEALKAEPWQQIVPDAPNAEHALAKLREIYPKHKEALGVYVFDVEPVKK